jgi:hypothetical protein
LGRGDGTFQAVQSYATGVAPAAVAVGDLNGDGMSDLAVANNGGNNVSVLLGKGDGTFSAAPSYGAGTDPVAVTMADFNGDGFPDLAVADQGGLTAGSGTVSILLGKGDGTFRAAVRYPAGVTPAHVAVGDFNGDGIPDLAVANFSDANGNGSVSILLGKGDGTFQAAVNHAAGLTAVAVAVADFNGDGIPDLAVANFGSYFISHGSVSILLGKGDGTFQPAVPFAAGTFAASVAVGDLNRDGIPDLVVADPLGGVVALLGKGDGTFQSAVHFATGSNTASVKVLDLNGDGMPDVAAANIESNVVSVLLGKGDGTFQPAVDYAVGPQQPSVFPPLVPPSSRLAIGDFNGDGMADLAVVFGGGVRLLLGNGDGTFQTSAISYVAGTYPFGMAAADLDGDGFPDLVVSNVDSNNVSILLNR